jgi:NAD(P)-dependent dehydrogenase (short-subunit alcohol dehydrogenase family)
MKIVVIGATGTIGAPVVKALAARKHEVIGASRSGETKLNIEDRASIEALFHKIQGIDAVVCCAGNATFKPFGDLTDSDYDLGLRSKLMGQVSLARIARDHLGDRGSITLTTGILAMQPMPGSASVSMINAGLEGFVRAAAIEMPRGVRINAVSPPWVKETLIALGMDPATGLAAADVAQAYVAAVEENHRGAVLDARQWVK